MRTPGDRGLGQQELQAMLISLEDEMLLLYWGSYSKEQV